MRCERVDGVLHQVVDGKAMLIGPAGREVVVLNGTGTLVWDALAGERDAASLVAAVHSAHPAIDVDTVTADVAAFLDTLEAAGLVRRT